MAAKTNIQRYRWVVTLFGIILALQPLSVFAIVSDPGSPAPTVDSWSLPEKSRQWGLVWAFTRCVSQYTPGGVLNGHIQPADMDNGDWFSDNAVAPSTFLSSGDHDNGAYSARGIGNPNGIMVCNGIIKDAVASWKYYKNYEDLYCTIYKEQKRANDSACRTTDGGSGAFNASDGSRPQKDFVFQEISSRVWGRSITSPDGAMRYVLYRAAFNEFCQPKATDNPASEYKYVVKEYSAETSNLVDTTYAGSRKNTDVTATYIYAIISGSGPIGGVGATASCKTIVSELNANAEAYGLWAKAHPEQASQAQANDQKSPEKEEKTTCSVEGVGWIICPAATFIGMLNDSLFGIIKHLLEINPKMFDAEGSNRSTYTVWESIRSIGNVAFIFAFLIIIYSQITGAGVTNYGIKRLLPKLIIAVILVNVSFWLCAILVDVSNVVGTSLYSLLDVQLKDVVAKGAGNNLSFWADLTGFLLAGGTGVLAAGGAALTVGTYGFFGALALLVPTAVAALFAFLVVVFVLVARQALVIILVVVSPLAFVALLLPNTESWFAKWRKTFFSLLLIYPAVALLFGGSQLAAAVIREGTTDVLVYILSLVVQVIPLFALPTLMKLSGGLLGQIAGRINNPNKGPFDRMKKAGRNYAERRKGFRAGDNIERVNKVRTGSGGVLGKEGSRRRRMAAWASGIGSVNSLDAAEKDKYGKIASEGAARSYVAKRALQDEQYATALAGGDPKLAKHVQGYATQAVKEEQKKDIAAARSLLSDRNAAEEDATGASTFVKSMVDEKQQGHEMAAYAAEIAARGPGRHFQDAIEASRHIKDAEKRRLVQNELITNMREDHAGVSDEMRGLMNVGALDESAQVGVSGTGEQFTSIYDSSFDQRIQTKASAETVVSMKAHDIELARRLIRSGQITDPSLTKLTELMDLAELNDTTKVKIKGQVGSMFEEARALAAKRSQG